MIRLLVLALLTVAMPAFACSPPVIQLPLKEKVANAPISFIGTVEDANDDHVTFRIVTPGKGAPAAGEVLQLEHKSYGTCGELKFESGALWLYAGDGTFSGSRLMEAGDEGLTIDAAIEKLEPPVETTQPDAPAPQQ